MKIIRDDDKADDYGDDTRKGENKRRNLEQKTNHSHLLLMTQTIPEAKILVVHNPSQNVQRRLAFLFCILAVCRW